MASRGRSATAGEDSERTYDSSPDPLALSFNDNNASSRRKTNAKEPLRTSSPAKQNRRLHASERIFSSPSKSMIMSTPRAGGASPWRIKVTVQAEPGSDEDNAESPSVKRVTRTKTTTVPLKDHDAPTPAKRPRGRPRKSDVGATPKPKRKGTPVKRTARSKSRDTNMRVGESSAADVDTDVPPKRRRGRPRKSVQPATEDDNTIVVEESESAEILAEDATPAAIAKSKVTSSKKSARFADVPENAIETMDDALRMSPAGFEDLPTTGTPRRTDLSQQLRVRKGTPHSKKALPVASDEEDGEGSDVLTPTSGEDDHEAQQASQDLAMSEEHHAGLLTPSETSAHSIDAGEDAPPISSDTDAGAVEFQAYEDDGHEVQDVTTFAFDEGTTRMPDDTTVLDSENFSMISVDSLPSNGGRSSPPKPEDMQRSTAPPIGSLLKHEYLRSSDNTASGSESPISEGLTLPSSQKLGGFSVRQVRPTVSRFKTPVLDADVPLAPPALEPTQPAVPKSETPGLGRVVTAGVALQGLLDPTRLTPELPLEALEQKRGSLDDLFRGFSEGTRKELQAGLRLGEQLAERHDDEPAPASSPIKGQSTAAPKEGVFQTQRRYRQSRLLTPEDQDHVITPAESAVVATDVQYPTLNVDEAQNAPPSPVGSESEMSWRVDTPSAAAASATREDYAVETVQKESIMEGKKPVQHDDYTDVWQEEASRSSNSAESEDVPAGKAPTSGDLFTDDGPNRPARGKLSRTWRRNNTKNLQHSDKTDSAQHSKPAHVEPAVSDQDGEDSYEVEEIVTPPLEDQPMQDEEESTPGSEASDDTGMFFQSNMPNVFKGKRPSRFEIRQQRRRNTEKATLSELLDQGESFVPECSPPMATKKALPTTKTNPFIDTPPRFPALMSSPKKSSPLRRELRNSDIATSSPRYIEEESTLPLVQSSPFRTIVDGDSILTAASDQRQFRVEMEGNTASTILRVREEANVYVDAYEPQERSLNEITEVTEPSRMRHHNQSLLPSSPPKMQQNFTQSLLSARQRALERSEEPTVQDSEPVQDEREAQDEEETQDEEEAQDEAQTSSPAGVQPIRVPYQPPGLLTRVKDSIWAPYSPPAPHVVLAKHTRLPKIEPWTRTHYKVLDKLYAQHIKHPLLFCPSVTPPTPIGAKNAYLLRHFLARVNNLPYVGAIFHAWGYEMCMTEEMVVICAVFMELLTFETHRDYEKETGKKILIGDCAPGATGDLITGEEVLRRLATVVLGESVRRDERAGLKIDRSRGLEIEWPQRGR